MAKKLRQRSASFSPRPKVLNRQAIDLGHFDGKEPVAFKAAIFQRIMRVARHLQILLIEGIVVDDQDAAFDQIGKIRDQCRGVHCHQGIDLVAGREDFLAGEMDLKPAHARLCAARGTNLGREIGKGRNVVADQGRGVGQLRAGQLHAVARVATESHRGVGQFNARLANSVVRQVPFV